MAELSAWGLLSLHLRWTPHFLDPTCLSWSVTSSFGQNYLPGVSCKEDMEAEDFRHRMSELPLLCPHSCRQPGWLQNMGLESLFLQILKAPLSCLLASGVVSKNSDVTSIRGSFVCNWLFSSLWKPFRPTLYPLLSQISHWPGSGQRSFFIHCARNRAGPFNVEMSALPLRKFFSYNLEFFLPPALSVLSFWNFC